LLYLYSLAIFAAQQYTFPLFRGPIMNLHNDRNLLFRVADGDSKAFKQLFLRHHQKLAVFLYRLTRDRCLAEELVQDVFVKIWHHRQHLAKVQHFDSYLFTAARNLAMNALRNLSRKSVKQREWEQSYQDTERPAHEQAFLVWVDEAVDLLPEQQKKVYILSRYKKYKYEQIAQQLNISRETVKKYLQYATQSILAHLRSRLDVLLILAFLFFFHSR